MSGGKVIHLSDDVHQKMMGFCREHDLQASQWVSRLILDAVAQTTIPVEKKKLLKPPQPSSDEEIYSRPPFWAQKKIDG